MGVYFALLLVFVRFSMIHEVALFYTGRHLYQVAALSVPASRSRQSATEFGAPCTIAGAFNYWLAFMGWLVLLALVTFCAAIFFLSLRYYFYLPALSGMAIAIGRAAQAEFSKAQQVAPERKPARAMGPGFRPKRRIDLCGWRKASSRLPV